MTKQEAKIVKDFVKQNTGKDYPMNHNSRSERLTIEIGCFYDDSRGSEEFDVWHTERENIIKSLMKAIRENFEYDTEYKVKRYQGFINSMCILVK